MNYLLKADSIYLLEEEINKIIADSNNVVRYNAMECELQNIIEEAAYISFLPDTKYIVIKNIEIFGTKKNKDDILLLEKYLNNPNEQSVLIFTTTDKLDERKKITKIMREKYKVIDIPKLKEYDLNKKINEIFKKDGYKIDFDTIKYISKNCLYNYDLIYNEIEKIKQYYTDTKQININDVKCLVSSSIEDNVFKFVNAVIAKDNNMFNLYKDIKLLKQEPIAIITLLAREYRNMYIIKTQNDMNLVCKTLGLQSWQYENSAKYAYNYTKKELKELLHQLFELDLKIKSGRIDKYLGLELFLLAI